LISLILFASFSFFSCPRKAALRLERAPDALAVDPDIEPEEAADFVEEHLAPGKIGDHQCDRYDDRGDNYYPARDVVEDRHDFEDPVFAQLFLLPCVQGDLADGEHDLAEGYHGHPQNQAGESGAYNHADGK